MIRTNKEQVVTQAVIGSVIHPTLEKGMNVSAEGYGYVLPMVGGITYNFNLGDNVFSARGEHLEPCVSIRNAERDYNDALNTLACIGNEAVILDGEAKGEKGTVIGKHGGVNHVLIQFEKEVVNKMNATENIRIKAEGQGLELLDFKDIRLMNITPKLLEAVIVEHTEKNISVLATRSIGNEMIGAGIGSGNPYNEDFDLMATDWNEIRELGLENLSIGDFVYINNMDCRYGIRHKRGYCTLGVVVHGTSQIAGHGPGILPVISGRQEQISMKIDSGANLRGML